MNFASREKMEAAGYFTQAALLDRGWTVKQVKTLLTDHDEKGWIGGFLTYFYSRTRVEAIESSLNLEQRKRDRLTHYLRQFKPGKRTFAGFIKRYPRWTAFFEVRLNYYSASDLTPKLFFRPGVPRQCSYVPTNFLGISGGGWVATLNQKKCSMVLTETAKQARVKLEHVQVRGGIRVYLTVPLRKGGEAA